MKAISINRQMRLFLFVIAVLFCGASYAQERPSIAIISMDTKDIEMDNDAMANLVRLELEKIDLFEVLDKYDVQETISKNPNPPSNYFGKTAALEAGELLKADKMLTGSVERFGDKIVFILRLVDVKSRKIEKTSVMEYQNVQNEIQTMTMISMNDLLGIENDKHLVDLLIDYDLPITSMRTTMNLNGPRMGMVYVGGENGDRMMDPKSDGGYDMFRVTSMFGYQFEKQYLSSGDFQALIEAVVAVNGLESGMIIPSLSFVNGFRFSKSGFEFGLGPNLRMLQTTEGYFSDGNWIRVRDVEEVPADAKVIERLDRRGDPKLSMGLIVAFGKTFQSGYLNIPFNLYVMPRKDGTMVGVTFGFNTTNRPKL